MESQLSLRTRTNQNESDTNVLSWFVLKVLKATKVSYHCPFQTANCSKTFLGELLQHFEKEHSSTGPLVQYFGPEVIIRQDSIACNNTFLITMDDTLFCGKFFFQFPEYNDFKYVILLCMWIVGSERESLKFRFHVTFCYRPTEKKLFGTTSVIHSLQTVPFSKMKELALHINSNIVSNVTNLEYEFKIIKV